MLKTVIPGRGNERAFYNAGSILFLDLSGSGYKSIGT